MQQRAADAAAEPSTSNQNPEEPPPAAEKAVSRLVEVEKKCLKNRQV